MDIFAGAKTCCHHQSTLRNVHFFIWILGLSEVRTHSDSHDNINNDNDDKTVDVENTFKSENATESNVEVNELFEDNKGNKPEPEYATHNKV